MSRKHRALVVDDEAEARETLRAACAALGHDVLVATTVEEASTVLKQERPCYLIVDNFLPLRDGMAPWARAGTNFLRDLRKTFSPKQLPVIVVTGRGSGDDVTAAFKAGMNDFAFKPFDRVTDEPLDKKIREVLEFGCESRRCCPHVGDADAPGRVYTASYRLRFLGDLKRGRALLEIDDEPRWLQRNTFEVLWKLWVEDGRSADDGWVHGNTLLGVKNVSSALGRVVADLEETAGIVDLVEWNRGTARVRLCTPPERVSFERDLMALHHRGLLLLLP